MHKTHRLPGGETLVFGSPRTIADEIVSANGLETTAEPTACMIAIGNAAKPDNNCIVEAIENLLDNGCSIFVCLGSKAEALHDLIDNLAERRDWTSDDGVKGNDVVTTWHDAEPLDEVVELFFTLCKDQGLRKLIVLIDDDFNDRQKLRTLLLKKGKATDLRKEKTP